MPLTLLIQSIWMNEFGGKNIGLYRDDGLSCFEKTSGSELEKIKNKMHKIFKDNGLNITIQTNLHIREYLDVTFNLKTGKCYLESVTGNKIKTTCSMHKTIHS